MGQLTVRRIAGAVILAALAVYFGSSADLVGLAVVVLVFIAGAASVAIGGAWLGSPGRLPPRYGLAAAGSAFGLIVAGTASALNVPQVSLVLAGAMAAFVGGVALGFAVIRFPDAPD